MPRPRKCRQVCIDPAYRVFKPQGIPTSQLKGVDMGLDELEAIRLSDVEGLPQAEAAKRMGISQPTFNRILSGARAKVAKALTEGVALKIACDSPDTHGRPEGTEGREAGGRS